MTVLCYYNNYNTGNSEMYFNVQKLINVHSRRLRRRECTSIYVKLFLRNKYYIYYIMFILYYISKIFNNYNIYFY